MVREIQIELMQQLEWNSKITFTESVPIIYNERDKESAFVKHK